MEQPAAILHYINPESLPQPFGYSQVVVASPGVTIYIAGQVPFDAVGQLVGAGDLNAQTHQVFANIQAALAAAGATFQQVVKLTYYLLDITQIAIVRDVRDQYIDTAQPPASSAVEVRRLFHPDVLIEVDAIAVVPAISVAAPK